VWLFEKDIVYEGGGLGRLELLFGCEEVVSRLRWMVCLCVVLERCLNFQRGGRG
jgi:hypothetical protein